MPIISYHSICRNVPGELRDYQFKAKSEICFAWDSVDNIMFQMPTGTGKTRLFTSIINDINRWGLANGEHIKVLIIAHRTELIDQIDKSLDKFHVPHGVIAGAFKDKMDLKKPVQVASIQTITNKYNKEIAEKLKFQFIIIDEAHHSMAETYRSLWKLYPNSKKLGVTATPWRMNGSGYKKIFDKLILSMPVKQFISEGWLSSYTYFSIKENSRIRRTIDSIHEFDIEGDYKTSALEREMDKDHIRAQLLDSYKKLAWGKKGIIYAICIEHANKICDMYSDAGLKVVAIDSKTSKSEREWNVERFRKGQLDIIVNVDIFSEGFDCPDIEFIQLARPTKSLVKYIQQVGRGLRRNGDKKCVILDNVGLHSRFGLPDARRHWNAHFNGEEVVDEPRYSGNGFGGGFSRNIDMSEGDEEMVAIQDVEAGEQKEDAPFVPESESRVIPTDAPPTTKLLNNSILPAEVEPFNPMPILKQLGYVPTGKLFWLNDNQHVYDSYVYEDGDYVIEHLNIVGRNIYREVVAKIKLHTMPYFKLETGRTDDIVCLHHFCKGHSVIGFTFTADSKGVKHTRYYDFIGAEYKSDYSLENIIDIENDNLLKHFEPTDVNMTVKKLTYQSYASIDKLVITKLVSGNLVTVARISFKSELAKLIGNRVKLTITNDDETRIYVDVDINGKPQAYRFNKEGIRTTGRTNAEIEKKVKELEPVVEAKKVETKPVAPKPTTQKKEPIVPKKDKKPSVIAKVPTKIATTVAKVPKKIASALSSVTPTNKKRLIKLKQEYVLPKEASAPFYGNGLRFVLGADGYFIHVIGGSFYYLKQAECKTGSLWVRPGFDNKEFMLSHFINGKTIQIGKIIIESSQQIRFVDVQNGNRERVINV